MTRMLASEAMDPVVRRWISGRRTLFLLHSRLTLAILCRRRCAPETPAEEHTHPRDTLEIVIRMVVTSIHIEWGMLLSMVKV